MCLVSASLQSHMSQTIEFLQIHEVDAALHTSLLHLSILTTDTTGYSWTENHLCLRSYINVVT